MSQKPLDESFYDQEMIRLFAPLEREFEGHLSLYVSGSWGDKRLTTSSDQDHLIITKLKLSDKEIQKITEEMRVISLEIEKLGLVRCDAHMMASNPHYIMTPEQFDSLNPVDMIAVYKGRLLAGEELRAEKFYNVFHATKFRKDLFKLLLRMFFTLLITLNSKKRVQHLKHMTYEEEYLFLSSKLDWEKRKVSKGSELLQAFSILKNCLKHYESFFS